MKRRAASAYLRAPCCAGATTGGAELDGLSLEARLVLGIERARERPLDDWRAAAERLEQSAPERWGVPGSLDELLREL